MDQSLGKAVIEVAISGINTVKRDVQGLRDTMAQTQVPAIGTKQLQAGINAVEASTGGMMSGVDSSPIDTATARTRRLGQEAQKAKTFWDSLSEAWANAKKEFAAFGEVFFGITPSKVEAPEPPPRKRRERDQGEQKQPAPLTQTVQQVVQPAPQQQPTAPVMAPPQPSRPAAAPPRQPETTVRNQPKQQPGDVKPVVQTVEQVVKPAKTQPMKDQTVKVKVDTKGADSSMGKLGERITQLGKSDGPEKAKDKTKKAGKEADETKSKYQKLKDTIGSIGQVAAIGFGVVSSAITSMWRVADPKGADDMEFAFGKLSIQIGRIFVPLLREVTKIVSVVADYLKDLTEEQADSIRWWVTAGLAVAGFLAILPTLISVLSGVYTAIVAVKGALMALAAGNPIGWAVIAIAALVALGVWLYKTGQLGMALQGVWANLNAIFAVGKSIVNAIVGVFILLWNIIQPIIRVVVALAGVIVGALGNAFAYILGLIKPVIDAIGAVITWLGGVTAGWGEKTSGILKKVGGFFTWLWNAIKPITDALMAVWDAIVITWESAVSMIGEMFTTMGGYFSQGGGWFDWLGSKADELYSIMSTVLGALAPLFEWAFGMIGVAIQAALKSLLFFASVMKNVLKGNFTGAVDSAMKDVEAWEKKMKEKKEEREKPKEPPTEEPKTRDNKNRGEVKQKAPQFVGLTELSRKIQTSQQDDAKAKLERDRLQESKTTNTKLDQVVTELREIKRKDSGGGFV